MSWTSARRSVSSILKARSGRLANAIACSGNEIIFILLEKYVGLLKEAKKLEEELNVGFKVSSNANNELPLYDYRKQLCSDLEQMRELYNQRQDEIKNFLAEQQLLCDALNEPLRHLPLDPMPSEVEVAAFGEYLIDLKTEKLKRENEIDCLKQEIGFMCDELGVPLSESVDKK